MKMLLLTFTGCLSLVATDISCFLTRSFINIFGFYVVSNLNYKNSCLSICKACTLMNIAKHAWKLRSIKRLAILYLLL